MKLIAGLGNPGDEYKDTPHNLGFHFLDILVKKLDISGFQKKFLSCSCRKLINGEVCVFMKPQTFMNKSGMAVAECANFFKIPIENIVIISDDMDLPPGKARFRKSGGHGGHNGLRSIIEKLGDNNFPRIRLGIGKPPKKGDAIRHVLRPWSKTEQRKALDVIDLVVAELINFLETSKFENTSFSIPEKMVFVPEE